MEIPTYDGDINEDVSMPDEFQNRTISIERLDLIYEDRGSSDLVITFGGCGDNPDTGESQYAMANLLHEYPVSRIMVRDQFNAWYLNGILGLSIDVYTTVIALRKYINLFDVECVITTGTSGGGYAAILFGILLNVDRVFAINPQSLLERGIQCVAHGNLYKLKWTNPAECMYWDLLNLKPTKTTIRIAYGRDDPVDLFHSGRLEALPNVELLQFAGRHHELAPNLRETGDITRLMLE